MILGSSFGAFLFFGAQRCDFYDIQQRLQGISLLWGAVLRFFESQGAALGNFSSLGHSVTIFMISGSGFGAFLFFGAQLCDFYTIRERLRGVSVLWGSVL